jgi:hypothetical protein
MGKIDLNDCLVVHFGNIWLQCSSWIFVHPPLFAYQSSQKSLWETNYKNKYGDIG